MPEAVSESKRKTATRKIYVFSTARGGPPLVTELTDDEEGHIALSNMVRVETVLAAVIGDKIALDLSSVVTLNIPGRKPLVDRMPIEVTPNA
jgi:hypothetical protein